MIYFFRSELELKISTKIYKFLYQIFIKNYLQVKSLVLDVPNEDNTKNLQRYLNPWMILHDATKNLGCINNHRLLFKQVF